LKLCLDTYGAEHGQWLIDFRNAQVRRFKDSDDFQYRYRFHSRWLKRILIEHVPWEDFFLSLRFSAYRDPDVYNDHLLGILKFRDRNALKAIERYEKRLSDETIVVKTSDGNEYEISRYCPHAGASLESGMVDGHTITCLNHHYVFDLDTGDCFSGNCRLQTKRLV
jgi:UDP-MurNAc hydroxylase